MSGAGPAAAAAAAAEAPPKVLALHGGSSNSNVMRFQTSQLRTAIGKGVEWLFPDSPVLGKTNTDLDGAAKIFWDYTASPLEERIANGKELASWFYLTAQGCMNPHSFLLAYDYLREYLAQEGPVAVLVAWSQATMFATKFADRILQETGQAPWGLSLFFGGFSYPHDCLPAKQLAGPVVLVSSPSSHYHAGALEDTQKSYSRMQVLEHDDGFVFPFSPPRAPEIYALLAAEVRKHCGFPPACVGAPEATGPALVSGGSATVANDASAETVGTDHVDAPAAFEILSPEAVAWLLLTNGCLVADARPLCESRSWAFPGAREDMSFLSLRMMAPAALGCVARLQRTRQRVVAVSADGNRCEECCILLVKGFGIAASRLCRLAGGVRGWRSWEFDNPLLSRKVSDSYAPSAPSRSVPRARPAATELQAAELASLMQAGDCLVVDAREKDESQGRTFPGAARGVGLLELWRRPREAERWLASKREDARRVVVFSATGGRCARYCELLVDNFGFPAARVCRLGGGLRNWDEWQSEHPKVAEELWLAHGPPAGRARGRALAARPGTAEAEREREQSLDVVLACGG